MNSDKEKAGDVLPAFSYFQFPEEDILTSPDEFVYVG